MTGSLGEATQKRHMYFEICKGPYNYLHLCPLELSNKSHLVRYVVLISGMRGSIASSQAGLTRGKFGRLEPPGR